MGYTTDFSGEFNLDKPVDEKTYKLLRGLATTRRMARNVSGKYGVEGEFYVAGKGQMGQDHAPNIIDFNKPPKTQPGLWCQWLIEDNHQTITWDGGEYFYKYIEWLQYFIDKIFKIRGYVLNGEVSWQGEETEDCGRIEVINNTIHIHRGYRLVISDDDLFNIKAGIMKKINAITVKSELKALALLINNFVDNELKEVIIDSLDDSTKRLDDFVSS